MGIKLCRGNNSSIAILKLIPLVFIIYTCEERTFDNPFDTGVELNPDDWAPTNLTIEILSDSDVILSWQNSKPNITVSKIERKISTGGSFMEIGSSETTNYTDTGLLTGKKYIYQVCAYSGDQKSTYIPSDTIMTVFPAPYNFSAESLNSGIVLTWDDSTAFEESFQIERKSISSNTFTILDSTQANTYLDSVISLGSQYIYRVSAFSNYNSSNYTATALVKYGQDCLDVWGGDAVVDNCGICDNDSSNDCNVDCAGVEDGTAIEDCSGECGGTAVEDECGVCNGSGSPENYDCDGNCTTDIDCNGDCAGNVVEDNCDVCGGDGSTCSTTVTDIDGNVYQTVQIGDQVWMAENLKVTHYKNGDEIPSNLSNSDWSSTSAGAVAVYNDQESNADTYGYLYNWYALDDSRGVCPEGWHVPSDNEYTILTDYLGGTSLAGGKMKEEGLHHWNSPNEGATNESGFTGLPAGYRFGSNGTYTSMGSYGYFWSSTEFSSSNAWGRWLRNNYSIVYRYNYYKQRGFSIRCLGD